MAESHEDDLFRKSSMSFGEHLEELRRRLFRAAMWLLGGVIIGFIFGGEVVNLIESPMEKALAAYYENKTLQTNAGPSDQALIDQGYISDQVFVQPSVVLRVFSGQFPELLKSKPGTAPATVPAAPQPGVAPNRSGNAPKATGDTSKPDAAATAADSKLLPITIWRQSKNDPRVQLKSFNAMEPFMIWLKAALLAGAIIASPFVFRELWLFVAAGLYPHERRYVYTFGPISLGLFIAGVLLAFFVAFPTVLRFLLSFNEYLSIDPEQRIEEFFNFALFLPLAFGVGFQLPLVMLFVNRIGLVPVETFIKQWRIAVLAIFILAMILTPSPDVYTMSLLAVPMSLLYFGGIGLCKWSTGRRPVGLGGE